MDNIFWLITVELTEDSILFCVNFDPELFNNHEKAMKRLNELNSNKKEYCGYFFSLQSLSLNAINENF